MTTTKSTRIAIPSELPFKDDEINLLQTIKTKIPQNSYLASLFTDDLINWVSWQLRQDLPPDLFDTYNHLLSTRDQEHRDREALLNQELGSAREKIKILETQVDNLLSAKDRLGEALDIANNRNTTLNFDLDRARENSTRLLDVSQSRFTDIQNLETQVAQLQDQVKTLKARMYDLLDGVTPTVDFDPIYDVDHEEED